jgi:D-aminoacyl-tRNA deacylase
MDIAIIFSSRDPAGLNIRNNLLELFGFEGLSEKFDGNYVHQLEIQGKIIKLYLTNEDMIFSENIDRKINADVFIFASKHRSKENTKSFAIHPIGNWDKADFGGKEKKLCPSSAALLKNLFLELNNAAKDSGYEITMEATHHGPYVEKPAVFVEIGSTESEWNDKENGKIIANTIINGLKNKNENYEIALAIGGPHYCNNFNKLSLRTGIAFSHFCPKHHLGKLNEDLIKQAISKTKEKADLIVLDWKGLGTEKQRIVDLLKSMSLEIKRTDQILKN